MIKNTAIVLRHVISAGCVIEDKIDVTPGKHIKMIGNVESFDQCAMKAAEIKNAKFWTYQPSTKNCWAKASNSKKVPLEGVVSGNVKCSDFETEISLCGVAGETLYCNNVTMGKMRPFE